MVEIQPSLLTRKTTFAGEHAATLVNQCNIDYEIPPHSHDFFEIALAAGGNGEHISANGVHKLSQGNLVIIRPGAWHGYIHCNNLVVLNCCFDQQLLQRELSWLREDAFMNFLLWTGPYLGDRRGIMIIRLFENSLAECQEQWNALRQVQGLPRRADTIGRLLIFIDSLVRSVEGLFHLKQITRPIHPAVIESMRLLESQIEQPWSLKALADLSHLDPSYLARLFKAEIGLAPISYLNHYRVERSAALLLHTVFPVSEIAAQVGWFDANLFARNFRMAYGMSPSEYRKRFGRSEAKRS